MTNLINKLNGPYFSFVLAEKDEYWERRGKVQRIVGIKSEYYHRPDALDLPDCIISLVVASFERSDPEFAYHGVTVYESKTLDRLIGELRFQAEAIDSCKDTHGFRGMLTELFVAYCKDSLGG